MKKTGLFYGTGTKKTAAIGQKIKEAFGNAPIDIIAVEEAWKDDFEKYDNLILGTATWFDGELPNYWDELKPELEVLELKGKKVAIFGLGDQAGYPDNFADGIGILADLFESKGAAIVGFTSPDEYDFSSSLALRNGNLLGLVLDIENQSDKTDERIEKWVKQLKKEFN